MILRDDDLLEWRDVLRSVLQRRVETTDLPEGPRVDRDLWRRLCEELDVAGLDVPEEMGGSAAGFGALAVVQRECGRVLAPLPVLGSVVVAQQLLVGAGAADLLPDLLAGRTVAAAVLGAEVDLDEDCVSGRLTAVLDGQSADLLVLATTADEVLVVDLAGAGVTRTPQESLDLTRDFATVELERAPVRRCGDGPLPELVADTRRRRTAAVASEQLGGAEVALERAVAYTLERVQFGRVIASFQALKHRCADLAIELDLATSGVEHAAWAVQEDAHEAPLAVAMAGSVCGPTYLRCALEMVQLHGGIGFTWEHPAHLHVRRAESDLALYGTAEQHREDVLAAL